MRWKKLTTSDCHPFVSVALQGQPGRVARKRLSWLTRLTTPVTRCQYKNKRPKRMCNVMETVRYPSQLKQNKSS